MLKIVYYFSDYLETSLTVPTNQSMPLQKIKNTQDVFITVQTIYKTLQKLESNLVSKRMSHNLRLTYDMPVICTLTAFDLYVTTWNY